jgi:hypothetical protein
LHPLPDRHHDAARQHPQFEQQARLLIEPAADVVQVGFVLVVDGADELRRFPEEDKDLFGLPPFPVEVRYSELQEFYFSLFLFLYFASAWRRLQAR